MKIYNKLCISVSLCLAMMMFSCTTDDISQVEQPKGLMPVLFSAGNMEAAITRAASASYMPENSRFVCSMFFHAGKDDTNDTPFYPDDGAPTPEVNMTNAWLKINNALGNAVYRQSTFADPAEQDVNGFDKAANCFYWQNRLDHVFLAIADNHKPTEAPKVAVGGQLLCDLTRTVEIDEMTKQPDPIVAHVKMSPAGATPEANRVKLFFKHQLAQIQVNIKGSGDASATIDEAQIDSVELLGVATTAFVPYYIHSDGTMPKVTFESPESVETPFVMFALNDTPTGYLKSFECIAFGQLEGIRITWRESSEPNSISHKAVFKKLDDSHKNLAGGTRYIYNIELRRGVIAQINTTITPWEMDTDSNKDNYKVNGTIVVTP